MCASCRSARLCARCGAGAAGTLHAYECHALTRLRDGEEGLSLAHSDLRLLLRALAVRRRALDAAADGDASDDSDEDETIQPRRPRRRTVTSSSTATTPSRDS